MATIISNRALSETIYEMTFSAHHLARRVQAGQFMIVRASSDGERAPFTFSDWNAEEGWVRFVYAVVGETTRRLSRLKAGERIADVVGPLGNPTKVGPGRWVILGGGVGTAVGYPVARALCEAGAEVTAIIAARSKDLLILTDEMAALPIKELLIVTDDGSAGEKGLITAPLERLYEAGALDHGFCAGPIPMMRACAQTAKRFDVPLDVSLNPLMVDGSGMCGACRCTVDGETKFACMDGPDFDGRDVNWSELVARLKRTPERETFPEGRISDFSPVDRGFTRGLARTEAQRCLQCKRPRCVQGCPVGVDIPGFIGHIREGNEKAALETILASNLMPSICGRVCPQENQCEGNCILGLGQNPDGAIAIGQLERYVGDQAPVLEAHQGDQAPQLDHKHRPAKPTNKRIAVIGSGPAGLACAGELARRGHHVTIFESFHVAGGVLAYGIPNFRLPKSVLQREIDDVKKLGVRIETNRVMGRAGTIGELMEKQKYRAVFVGAGAGLPRFLGIPGENLAGVMSANEFLTRANLIYNTAKPDIDEGSGVLPIGPGNRVVVVGGGNVAFDAARVALRLGAKSVQLVYRRSEKELPARAVEVKHAKQEGVEFRMLLSPKEILDDGAASVRGVLCDVMRLGEPDESGRRSVTAVPGSERVLPCDTVIIAVGTRANPLMRRALPEAELDSRGYLVTDENSMTSVEGVWAGGDIVTGSATVIKAMGAGKKAAGAIDVWLKRRS